MTFEEIIKDHGEIEPPYSYCLITIFALLSNPTTFQRLLLKAKREGKMLDIDDSNIPHPYSGIGEEKVILVTPEEWKKRRNWS